jgi:replication-associated recombination protein RarA
MVATNKAIRLKDTAKGDAKLKELGYSDGYLYAHDFEGNFADLEFMPESLSGTVLYEPQDNRHEAGLKAYLEKCWPKYYGPGKDQKG